MRPPLRRELDLLVSGFFGCALVGRRSAVGIRCSIVGRGRTRRLSGLLCDVGLRSGGAFRTLGTGSSRRSGRAAGSRSAGRPLGSRVFVDGLFTADGGGTHQERDSPDGGISGNDSKILLHGYRLSASVDSRAFGSNHSVIWITKVSDRLECFRPTRASVFSRSPAFCL
jgi:hypothetical protein